MSNYVEGHVTKYSAGEIVKFPNIPITIPSGWEVIECCSPFGWGDYRLDIFTGKDKFTVTYTISPVDILEVEAENNATDYIREKYWKYIFDKYANNIQ